MEEPRVIPAGLGAGSGGHDRRTKPRIYSRRPFTISPSLPPRAGLFPYFLCFSCLLGHPGADTHTKSEWRPSLSPCHQRCEPLRGPGSTVVSLIRLAEPAQGQPGLGAGRALPGILFCTGCGCGVVRKGPQKVWARRFCPCLVTAGLVEGIQLMEGRVNTQMDVFISLGLGCVQLI